MKKIYFVNGALGSGKTTLINQLIDSKKMGKFFMIENEVSSLSIDNMCLHLDPKQIKVFAGECICCSDPEELVKILEEVSTQDYENVVIESSGVTSLNQLLGKILSNQSLAQKYTIGACVFLVDALGIDRTSVNDLEISDFVVVTKYDELKHISQFEKIDDFVKNKFPLVKFQIKENLLDSRWIEKLLSNTIKTFREWSLLVNSEKHHGQNFVQVLLPTQLQYFVPDIAHGLMSKFQVNRLKGFYQKNGLVYHVEATPELLVVKVSVEPVSKFGIVVIGGNKVLLDEYIAKILS